MALDNHVKVFDPFSDRSARIVRNTLSEMLRNCLGRREVFSRVPDQLLAVFSQPPYADYIQDRFERYRAATAEALVAGDAPMAPADVLWRHGLYFEFHEVLEPLWQAATGDKREGLKGLIQAAGAWVHREAGRDAAAVGLAKKAVTRLRRFGNALDDMPTVQLASLVGDLEKLVATAEAPPIPKTISTSEKES